MTGLSDLPLVPEDVIDLYRQHLAQRLGTRLDEATQVEFDWWSEQIRRGAKRL